MENTTQQKEWLELRKKEEIWNETNNSTKRLWWNITLKKGIGRGERTLVVEIRNQDEYDYKMFV